MRSHVFESLVQRYNENRGGSGRSHWVEAAKQYFGSAQAPAVLGKLAANYCIALHGSSSRDIDDSVSDLDFWLLLDEKGLAQFDQIASNRFIDVEIEGKPGHLNPMLLSRIEQAFVVPDLEIIYELRSAEAIDDPECVFGRIQQRARLQMSPEMRKACFFRNYVDMRSWHRSADNPMERHDIWSSLTSVAKTVDCAIRCAIVLDNRPYPYEKWLYVAAHQCPTGLAIVPSVERIIDMLGQGRQSLLGPEKENAISMELRAIRKALVGKARSVGIDEPWLIEWWRYIDEAEAAFGGIGWPA